MINKALVTTMVLVILALVAFWYMLSCERPAQRAAGNIITAASTSAADVSAAIAQAQDGDTVNVPAGTSTWTTQVWVSKAITLQGAGIGQTIIKDGANGTQFLAARLVAGKLTRFTGFEFQNGGRTQVGAAPAGLMKIYGTNDGSQWRFDHNKWTDLNGYLVTDTVVGVVDHNDITIGGPVYEWTYPYGNAWNGKTYGDGSWEMPANWGSSQFLFFEDNTINCTRTTINCSITDGFNGARFVFRYNTVSNGNIGDHGTESPGRGRSSRAKEIYRNKMDGRNVNKYPVGTRGGSTLFHDNTITNYQGAGAVNSLSSYRMVEDFNPWGGADGTNKWDKNNPGSPFATFTATAVSGRTVTANVSWTSGQWVGYTLKRTAGVNNDYGYIDSNTSNTVTYRSGGYGRDMVVSVGDTFQINKVDQSLDQAGVGQSSAISGDNPTPPPNFSQVVEACYSWGNTNDGQPWNNFAPATANIKANVNYFNNVKPAGYTEYQYPHPLVSGGGVSPTPAPTALPTATATATILPTVTPSPSPLPSPTATSTPVATPTPVPSPSPTPTATATTTVAPSPSPSTTAEGAPIAPSNLVARVIRGKRVELTWQDNSDNEVAFEIARTEATDGSCVNYPAAQTVPAQTTTWADETTGKKKTYCYRVRAVGQGGAMSEWTNDVMVSP